MRTQVGNVHELHQQVLARVIADISSTGHAVTHGRPLSFRRTRIADFEAYRVDGTPAECVALGLSAFPKADLVLSGINVGPNLGNSMWHSGTLAAAKQATLLGVRGVALSAPSADEPDFEPLKPFVAEVLKELIAAPDLTLVNVNFPPEPRGMRWTRQSVRHYDDKIVPAKDPMGREHDWFTVIPLEPAEEGGERWAVEHGYVSMTPLRLDLTDAGALAAVRQRRPLGEARDPKSSCPRLGRLADDGREAGSMAPRW